MFSSRGLFKEVPCPGKHNCTLPNCLFKHDFHLLGEANSNTAQVYDPESIMPPESSPSPKRRRKNSVSQTVSDDIPIRHNNSSVGHTPKTTISDVTVPEIQTHSRALKRSFDESFTRDSTAGVMETEAASKKPILMQNGLSGPKTVSKQPASATRPVSPPAIGRLQKSVSNTVQTKAQLEKDEPFHARKIGHNPIQYGEREKKLKLFHKQLDLKQQSLRKMLKGNSNLILSEAEVQKLALNEEERVAKAASNLDTYTNLLKDRLTFYTKMTLEAYQSWVPEIFRATAIDIESQPPSKKVATDLKSGLQSVEKEKTILKLLRTGLHQHAKHGYIIKPPSEKEIQNAISTEKMNKGWEACDRCQSRFQIFRGRNEEGLLTTGGECLYHWGRISPARGASKKYPCCQQEIGSTGCQVSQHHVFKVSDPARLAALMQFKETTKHNDTKKRDPVVFDCEMGYTTCGLELIRLTALAWPTKATLLDILVRPWGEVLDLNTRFSGVTTEIFYNAPNYGHGKDHPFPKYTPGEKLQKVASPAAARDYLFDLLDPETPLIGHAIDNDLNACRVIHPFVIDTVLLFPHERPLPIRRKLKDLALTHLQRVIQAADIEGHDSREDSEATGDLVLVKVKEKWEELKSQGWWWKENTLMPPTSKAKTAPSNSATAINESSGRHA